VAVFFTGGTLGMRGRPGEGDVAPAGAFDQLMAALAPSIPGVSLTPVAWADVPSSNMTPERMFALGRDVEAMLAEDDVCGAVVAHGTDVMEETAYMLDLTVDSDKPVVVTGSMRSLDELGYDGLRNLYCAVLACLECPPGAGVVVLMSDRLYAASEVAKTHSMAIDAFDAPGLGPLGSVAGEVLHLSRWPARQKVLKTSAIEPNVDLISLCPGMDGRFIACARENGAAGLVVEGFGAGNVPPAVADALEPLLAEGLPVVLTSRCIQGGVWPIYGYHGGAGEMARKGIILGGALPGNKARIKLMVALGLTRELAAIRSLFP
jgi:L-asparaginase